MGRASGEGRHAPAYRELFGFPMISTVVFWFIALMTVGSAVLVVTAKNILHAGFALCLTFLGVAGLYVFLHADFVAAVQLIVYVGGILAVERQ